MAWSLKLGASAPLDWTEGHEEILRLSDRLWDDLLWAWRRSRQLEEAAEDATGDAPLLEARAAHREAEAAVDAAFEARRRERQRLRSRDVPAEIEAAIETALARRRETRGRMIEEARRVRRAIRPQLQSIWRARDAACRSIAAGRGRRYPQLHWAQCNDILARYETAAREAAKRGRLPRPAREHPSQSFYVQLQAQRVGGVRVEVPGRKRARVEGGELRGTTWGALTAEGRRAAVRIEPGHRPGRRVGKPQEVRRMLLRLPCGDAAAPLAVPVTVPAHREPAEGALVKGVRLVRRGREWSVIVSIDGPPLHPSEPGAGVLYCGLGWRRTRHGLRVLDGVDEAGVRVQVHVPREYVASVTYADALVGALDRAAEVVAARLAALREESDPHELVRRRDWRALRALALASGDPDLEAWVRGVPVRERHAALLAARREVGSDAEKYAERAAAILGDIAGRDQVDGLRRKATRRREHLYRRCARWLAERYGRIVVAESDGRKLARVEDPETGRTTDLPLPARRARQAAAPYSLLAAVRWAAKKAGGEVVEASAADASHTCPLCGEEMERSASDRAALHLRCSAHGVWDRDHALALALWRDAAPGDRERWEWHAGQRSRAEIVRVDAEVERDLRGHGQPHSRLRYVAGVALADRVES